MSPLLTSAAVRVTVEELKTVLSRLSVIVALFLRPLIVTVVVARSSASPPATLIGSATEAAPSFSRLPDGKIRVNYPGWEDAKVVPVGGCSRSA